MDGGYESQLLYRLLCDITVQVRKHQSASYTPQMFPLSLVGVEKSSKTEAGFSTRIACSGWWIRRCSEEGAAPKAAEQSPPCKWLHSFHIQKSTALPMRENSSIYTAQLTGLQHSETLSPFGFLLVIYS